MKFSPRLSIDVLLALFVGLSICIAGFVHKTPEFQQNFQVSVPYTTPIITTAGMTKQELRQIRHSSFRRETRTTLGREYGWPFVYYATGNSSSLDTRTLRAFNSIRWFPLSLNIGLASLVTLFLLVAIQLFLRNSVQGDSDAESTTRKTGFVGRLRSKSTRSKFRWYSLLILTMIFLLFIAYRWDERSRIKVANVIAMNVTGYFDFQEPKIVERMKSVPNYYDLKLRSNLGEPRSHEVVTEVVEVNSTKQQGFGFWGFLMGTHDDIAYTTIAIDARSVNESSVEQLRNFKRLETVLILVHECYYSVEASGGVKEGDVNYFGVPLQQATELFEKHRPDLKIHRRGYIF